MSNAQRDSNYVTTLMGVNLNDLTTPELVAVDPANNRMMVSAIITSGSIVVDDIASMLTELYVESGAMAKRIVQVGSIYYMGWAAPGTATNTNAWRISRVDTSGSPEIAVTTFADGNREFDNNWDDVLILSYS